MDYKPISLKRLGQFKEQMDALHLKKGDIPERLSEYINDEHFVGAYDVMRIIYSMLVDVAPTLNPRGTWDANTAYEPLDLVTFNGDLYIVRNACTGENPVQTPDNYMLLFEQPEMSDLEGVVYQTDIVNNLDSTDPNKVMSAAQGSVLKNLIANAGKGDMNKSDYDTDSDGVVDNSEALEGHPASYFAEKSSLTSHTGDTTSHITSAERTKWNAKQDAISGTQGQIVGFDSSGKPIAQTAPDTGVTTFNGRKGAVTPASGDYTAAQVGAVPKERTINGFPLSADVEVTGEYYFYLDSNKWTNNVQSVNVEGLDDDVYGIVFPTMGAQSIVSMPSGNVTYDGYHYRDSVDTNYNLVKQFGVYLSNQKNGTLTFRSKQTVTSTIGMTIVTFNIQKEGS